MVIDPKKQYLAKFKTSAGDFYAGFYADRAPITVNNFIFLARDGYYDDVIFHRVIPGFVAQGGDPTGTGSGGPGYRFEDEFDPSLRHNEAGILSMANSGPGTNGSQFFILYAPQPHLNDKHSVFGKVVKGFDVVKNINGSDSPSKPATKIITIEISEK
ncbi:MAG: peptidylprolyl isomerase [Anaerolineaceae bacterium]|nr:peptidylprolyl isomerase [Anaerolineaceae bacterium]